ncbi:unnamed protein product [Linum trigynum]|uniref:RNase H type-1 domain-containing protein n=1 Tax=Linum trigynum TaxID=586398 RepID=A0AAV2FIY9_9ROSI
MVSETSPFHIFQCVCLHWRIWKSINKVIFEFYQPHVRSLARHFYNQVLDISNTLLPPQPHNSLPYHPTTTWVQPPDDHLKINFDAAVCATGCSSGFVVLGSDGHVVLAFGLQHQGIVNPSLAELLAIRDAISIIT